METRLDFVDRFQSDVASMIFSLLDDSADLVRATGVSRGWRDLVIANCLSKKLCLRKIPPMANISSVVEENDGILRIVDAVSTDPINWETLLREHRIYTTLLKILADPIKGRKECLAFPVGASSTDRDPVENVVNTLVPLDRYSWGPSYWSSSGQSDPNVPEHILYRLITTTCIIKEILIRPFEVFYADGNPVCSAKSVRFRMGHPKSVEDLENLQMYHLYPSEKPSLDKYVWTYTSPEFPMAQESRMQHFELPEPAICMGGFLLIELLGRVQRAEADGLYYICLGHVKVLGLPLEPAFKFLLSPWGEPILKYSPHAVDDVIASLSDEEEHPRTALTGINQLRHLGELLFPVDLHQALDRFI